MRIKSKGAYVTENGQRAAVRIVEHGWAFGWICTDHGKPLQWQVWTADDGIVRADGPSFQRLVAPWRPAKRRPAPVHSKGER